MVLYVWVEIRRGHPVSRANQLDCLVDSAHHGARDRGGGDGRVLRLEISILSRSGNRF